MEFKNNRSRAAKIRMREDIKYLDALLPIERARPFVVQSGDGRKTGIHQLL